MDNCSKAGRSSIMRAIKPKGNKTTERRVRAHLIQSGIRGWRLHGKGLPGTPDFVFDAVRVVVFVDGCFWHACDHCNHRPATKKKYWNPKLDANKARDLRNTKDLEAMGWVVLRIWEHEIKDAPREAIARIRAAIDSIMIEDK